MFWQKKKNGRELLEEFQRALHLVRRHCLERSSSATEQDILAVTIYIFSAIGIALRNSKKIDDSEKVAFIKDATTEISASFPHASIELLDTMSDRALTAAEKWPSPFVDGTVDYYHALLRNFLVDLKKEDFLIVTNSACVGILKRLSNLNFL